MLLQQQFEYNIILLHQMLKGSRACIRQAPGITGCCRGDYFFSDALLSPSFSRSSGIRSLLMA